ncbi:MAG: type II toxin-antitoxin system VapC family toxin [Myxococcales bacterium]|nr:type II toxin-antitoxin system VapC family toxin [Myxococcales bacterium]
MILDTSAITAVVFQEPGYESLRDRMSTDESVGIGSATLVEAGIVLSARLRRDARDLLARFLQEADVRIVPFDEDHWAVAVDAWLRFGKGRHPARLNFGDCLSYATARLAGEPLLCVGEDFPKTDLELA